MTATNPSQSSNPSPQGQADQQKDFEHGAAAALAVILLLALVVVIFLNFIPYYMAAAWIVNKVPGLNELLSASSKIVFPIAVAGVSASVYFFARGIVGASKKTTRHKKAKHLPVALAFIAAMVCIVSKMPASQVFVACLGTIAGAFITLVQFRWILFQHNAKAVLASMQDELKKDEPKDEDLRIATRSERQTLKSQNNVAMVVDGLVSLCVYPPVAMQMLPVVLLTANFAAVDWGNVIMIFVTTVLTGWLLRFYLGQAKKAQG